MPVHASHYGSQICTVLPFLPVLSKLSLSLFATLLLMCSCLILQCINASPTK